MQLPVRTMRLWRCSCWGEYSQRCKSAGKRSRKHVPRRSELVNPWCTTAHASNAGTTHVCTFYSRLVSQSAALQQLCSSYKHGKRSKCPSPNHILQLHGHLLAFSC